jgi:hypothetical protein
MNYKEIETQFMGVTQKHIIIDNGDGSFKSFPADRSNPEYLVFLGESEAPEETEAPEAE